MASIIPTYDRQEDLAPLPSARLSNTASANSYGANVASAATGLANAALQKAQEFEYTKALSALNAFQKEIDDLHLDPDKGLYQTRKLGNANGMSYDAEGSMKEIAAKYYTQLTSPFMKQVFSQQGQKIVIAQNRANQKWEAAQLTAYKTQEAESAINNGYNKIGLYYDDPEQVDIIRETMRPYLEFQLEGMGEEKRAEELAKFESNIALIQAGRMIENRPLEATEWIKQNKDRFTAEVYDKVLKKAEAEAEPYEIELIRDELLKKFGNNEAAAHKFIIDNYEGEKEKKILSLVEAEYSDRRRIKNQRESDWLDYMRNSIASAGSLSAALAIVNRAGGEPQHRVYLENYAKSIYGGGGSGSGGESDEAYELNKIHIRQLADTFAAEHNINDTMSPLEREQAAALFVNQLVKDGVFDEYPIKASQLESIVTSAIYNRKLPKEAVGEKGEKLFYDYKSNSEINSMVNHTFKTDDVVQDAKFKEMFERSFQDAILLEAQKPEYKNAPIPEWRYVEMAKDILSKQVQVGVSTGWLWDTKIMAPQIVVDNINKINKEVLAKHNLQYKWIDRQGSKGGYFALFDVKTGLPVKTATDENGNPIPEIMRLPNDTRTYSPQSGGFDENYDPMRIYQQNF